MMKIFTAISLSVLMLMSSIGFSINKHYCQSTDEYIYTFFGSTDSCSCVEADKSDSCHHHSNCEKNKEVKEKKGCCDDETLYFQLSSDFSHEVANVSLGLDWNFVIAIYHVVLDEQITLNDNPNIINFNTYTPPCPDCDFCVAFQSFLI